MCNCKDEKGDTVVGEDGVVMTMTPTYEENVVGKMERKSTSGRKSMEELMNSTNKKPRTNSGSPPPQPQVCRL